MTRSRLAILSMAAATSFVGAPHAQDPRPALPADSVRGFMESAVVDFVDGELWATQARWKAQFAADAVHFTPTLGAGAPRSLPVSLRMAGIERGSTSVLSAADAAVPIEPTLHDDSVRYARTPDILETYDVADGGVELSVVFQRPLPGTGDLVVRMRLDTELTAAAGSYERELILRDGEAPIVGIGQVVGIDALGRRGAGELRWDGEQLELVLPGAFVDTARYPLVLDPFIGSRATLDAGAGNDTAPDVAYDVTNDVYLVVWNHAVSSTDNDNYAQRIQPDGTPVGSRIPFDVGSPNVHSPRVCNLNLSNAFFAVEVVESTQAGLTVRGVYGRAIRASDGLAGPFLTIVQPVYNPSAPGNDIEGFDPDVCGERTLTRDGCLVIWRQYGAAPGIYGVDITVPANLASSIAGTPRRYMSAAFADLARPAICNSFGDSFRAMVAWHHNTTGIRYVVVDRFGNALTPISGVGAADPTATNPAVDGDGNVFLLAYRRNEPGCSCTGIQVGSLEYVNGTVRGFGFPIDVSPSVDQNYPAVAMVRPPGNGPALFGVTWSTYNHASGAAHAMYATFVDWSIGQVCGAFDVVTEPSTDHTFASPRMFSRYNGGALRNAWQDDEAMIAFMGWNGSWTIRARGWQAFGSGGSVWDVGGQCGDAGDLHAIGPFAVGNPDFALELIASTSGPLGPFNVLNLAFGTSPGAFSCGSTCQYMLNPFLSAGAPLLGGRVKIGVPIPCDSRFLGLTLSGQFLSLTPPTDPCGLGPVSPSNRLTMTLGR